MAITRIFTASKKRVFQEKTGKEKATADIVFIVALKGFFPLQSYTS